MSKTSFFSVYFAFSLLCLPFISGCKDNSSNETQELTKATDHGPFFVKLTKQSGWLKGRSGETLINGCLFNRGTVLQLLGKVDPAFAFQGLNYIKLKSKTFSQQTSSLGGDETPEITDTAAVSNIDSEKETLPRGGLEPTLSLVDSTTSEVTVEDQKVAMVTEPVVCNMMDGYIDPNEWEGSVLSRGNQFFPIVFDPIKSCLSFEPKETAFGFRRNGRLHAACDMHAQRKSSEPVFALEEGIVRDRYSFGIGLECAIEVTHPSFDARYGETSCKYKVEKGELVKTGQLIARLGTIWARRDVDMLHLELFRGNVQGPLTQPGRGKYSRRSDLYDPTAFLQKIIEQRPLQP